MKDTETNPLSRVSVDVEAQLLQEVTMLPRSSNSKSTRCLLGIAAVAVVLLLVAGLITMPTSSDSASSAAPPAPASSQKEVPCQVHNLRAHFNRFNVAWNFTNSQGSNLSCRSAQTTVSMGSSCEFVCSHGFRDSQHRRSDTIDCKQDGKWDFSRTGPRMCLSAQTNSPTVSPTTKSPTTASPTTRPTRSPTKAPTKNPTKAPSKTPTVSPTKSPTSSPTVSPTASPSVSPTSSPTVSRKQIGAGFYHTCAALESGTMKCWGLNDKGQLGDSTTKDRKTPVNVSGLTGVKLIAVGWYHTCATLDSDTTKCWGLNNKGQLGDNTNKDSNTPVTVSGLTGVKLIAAGSAHTCAMLDSGKVKCWGWNQDGLLGDKRTKDSNTPVNVTGLTGVKQIAAGWGHACATLDSGKAKCWGSSVPASAAGLTGVKQIAAGESHTCAALDSGTVKCMGKNREGQIGNKKGGPNTVDCNCAANVFGLTGVKQVTARGHTSCAVLDSGTAKCWGGQIKGNGQLGDGTWKNSNFPVNVTGLTGVKQITAGMYHTCAMLNSGTAKCWGLNDKGQLGDGSGQNHNSPVKVSGLAA